MMLRFQMGLVAPRRPHPRPRRPYRRLRAAARHRRARRLLRRRDDIAARYTDGPDAGRLVRPGRFATHPDPLTTAADGWRRAEASAA